MIVSCFVLIGGGMLVGNILGLIYGYDSNWDELKSPELLDNALFYFVTNLVELEYLQFGFDIENRFTNELLLTAVC